MRAELGDILSLENRIQFPLKEITEQSTHFDLGRFSPIAAMVDNGSRNGDRGWTKAFSQD